MSNSRVTSEFVQNLLKDEYPLLTVESTYEAPGSNRGDNYTAMLFRVYIEGSIQQDKDTEENRSKIFRSSLIYKCLPESATRREAYKSDVLFCNEVAFYTKCVPKLLSFRNKRLLQSKPNLRSIPKFYLAQNDLLILEDLQCRHFQMPDRRKGLNEVQCYAVLKELAILHATSLAMKYEDTENFYELMNVQNGISEAYFDNANEEWYKDYYRTVARNATIMLKESLTEINDGNKYLQKFEDFIGDGAFFKKMVELVAPKEPLAVICHGDCWTNNILFQYDSEGEITEVCLVDFQLVRYGSPALDLTNLIYCCTTRKQRSEYLESFLEYYIEALHKGFTELIDIENYTGCLADKNKLYNMLQDEFKRCGKYGLGIALDMFPIMTCDSDQAPDLYEQEDKEVEAKQNSPVCTSNEACKQKLLELVQELVDKGHL